MIGLAWPETRTQPFAYGDLVYRRLGSGPDLVFLHGLLGAGVQWRDCALTLAARFTCSVLEFPGISRSTRLRSASLPELADWLQAAARALGIERFAIAASSWGGAVALQYASEFPQQVPRLVLDAPSHPFWRPNFRQRILLWPPATRAAAWLGRHLSWRRHRKLLEAMYGKPERVTNDSVDDYRRRLCKPGLGPAVVAYARTWQRDQRALRRRLAAIHQPVLLVWGDHDCVIPVPSARPLQAALPYARLVCLPGLGHLAFEEDPGAFTAAALPFLQG